MKTQDDSEDVTVTRYGCIFPNFDTIASLPLSRYLRHILTVFLTIPMTWPVKWPWACLVLCDLGL